MLFAFVACNPNSSSSSSADDALLPGEVTPPAESEKKSMSDADIVKVAGYWNVFYSDNSKIEIVRERKIEVDFGESETLSIKENSEEKEGVDDTTTFTVDGKITVGSDSYVVDNLVLVYTEKHTSGQTPSFDYAIKEGSITKNGTAMNAKDAYTFLGTNFSGDDQCKAYTVEDNKQTNFQFFDDNGKTIGIGTEIAKYTTTKDEDMKGVLIYDCTIDGSRIQAKTRQSGREMSIDYVALDGVFFDKTSCDKLLSLIYKS